MNKEKILNYFENSFLKDLLEDSEITDISYNGKDIYYLHNHNGRQMFFHNQSRDNIKDFVRQLANLSERQFSFSSPVLDISFDKYRFTALHQCIGKLDNDDVITFSVRIASKHIHITKDSDFFSKPVGELIDVLVKSKVSIVIGGITGSGKTEFQKYLLSRMPDYTRVIVIDNVLELDMRGDNDLLDLNIWQADERNKNTTIQFLIKTALRSNPDWLIVAESRGEEMIDVLNSAMTGHPIITTLHAFDAESMPHRMTSMVMMNDKKMSREDILQDILYHFRIFFFLKREITPQGKVKRYLTSIVEFDGENKNIIYEKRGDEHYYGKLSNNLLKILDYEDDNDDFILNFVGGEQL